MAKILFQSDAKGTEWFSVLVLESLSCKHLCSSWDKTRAGCKQPQLMQWHRGRGRGSWHVLDPTPASIWWIFSPWGWLGINLSHQGQLPIHAFTISLLCGHHTVSSSDPQPADNTNAWKWQRVSKEQQQQHPFLKSPKKLRSSWLRWSVCLAPSSHTLCSCFPCICCRMGRIEGNWGGNTSEHQNYFCLTFVFTSKEVFWFIFLGCFFFQYKDKFDQIGQTLEQAPKRLWKIVDTYWQYV